MATADLLLASKKLHALNYPPSKIFIYLGKECFFEDMHFSHDDTKIIISDRHGAKIWNAINGDLIGRIEGEPSLQARFSHDDTQIAIAFEDSIAIYNTATLTEKQKFSGHTETIWALCWSKDDNYLASSSDADDIIIWNPKTGESIYTLASPHGDNMIMEIKFFNLKSLISSGADCHTKIWDIETKENIVDIESQSEANFVRFSPWDPRYLMISCGEDTRLLVDQKQLFLWKIYTTDGFFSFLKRNDLILVCSNGIQIYDLRDGKLITTLDAPSALLELVMQSKNGEFIFGVGDKEVRVWDVLSRTHVKTLTFKYDLNFTQIGSSLNTFDVKAQEIVKACSSHDTTRFFVGTLSGNLVMWEFDLYRKTKLNLLLLLRERVSTSVFSKEALPIDLFKYICQLAQLYFKQ